LHFNTQSHTYLVMIKAWAITCLVASAVANAEQTPAEEVNPPTHAVTTTATPDEGTGNALQINAEEALHATEPNASSLASSVEPENSKLQSKEPVIDLKGTELDDDPNEYGFLEQQIDRGEASSAAASLDVIVHQIETLHHRYHEDLIKPLTLLGDAQLAQSDHDAAIETYARARHIARVSQGLFNEAQLPIVYREADVFRSLGDMRSAAEKEEYAFEVARRSYVAPDPRSIPATARLATFYISTYNPISARTLLMKAMAVHEQNGTHQSPEAIPLLRGIAQTHRMSRFPPFYVTTSDDNRLEGPTPGLTTGELDGQFLVVNSFPEGERALQSIVAIQRENFPDQPTLELDAILELADWHLLFGRYQAAHALYNHVFMRMAELNQRPEEFFATPAMLYFPRPDNPRSPPARDRAEITEGLVSLGFTVTSNGHVRTLKTLESEPPKLMDFRVRRSMRIAKFRPRYVEGQPVSAEDQTFTYRFPYYAAKEPVLEMESDSDAAEPGDAPEATTGGATDPAASNLEANTRAVPENESAT
jgi:TonB family protein